MLTHGNIIAQSVAPVVQPSSITMPLPKTLPDLLAVLETDKHYGMMRAAAQHYSEFMQLPIEQVPVNALVNVGPSFTQYLLKRHYKRNSARSYRNYVLILLARAKQLGALSSEPEHAGAWKEILSAMPKDAGTAIVRFAIRIKKTPAEFADSDLNRWGQEMLEIGRAYETCEFRKI